jgi:hypothetical protein
LTRRLFRPVDESVLFAALVWLLETEVLFEEDVLFVSADVLFESEEVLFECPRVYTRQPGYDVETLGSPHAFRVRSSTLRYSQMSLFKTR